MFFVVARVGANPLGVCDDLQLLGSANKPQMFGKHEQHSIAAPTLVHLILIGLTESNYVSIEGNGKDKNKDRKMEIVINGTRKDDVDERIRAASRTM